MCRSIVRFFLAAFIILFGTLLIFLFNIRFQLLEANYYKAFLKNNDVYKTSIEAGKSYIENSDTTEGTLLIQPLIDAVLKDFVTPELAQTVVERNLDNAFSFIHGRNERLLLYFPKQQLLERLSIETIDNLETEINSLIGSLPVCKPGEENELSAESIGPTSKVKCLPAGFEAPTQDFSKILEEIGNYTGTNPLEGLFEENGPLKGLSEETDIAKLIADSPREEGSPDPEQTFKTIQTIGKYIDIGLLIAGIVLLLSILLYVLLGGKENLLSSTGTILLILGIPVVLLGGFLSFSGLLGSFIYEKLIVGSEQAAILTQFSFVPELLAKFVGGVFLPLFISGVIMVVFGTTLLILNKILKRNPPQEISETPKSKPDVIQKGKDKNKKP